MGITESVIAAIQERLHDADVVRVKLEIGKLSGVAADSVRFCFDVASIGSPLEGAKLEIDEPTGQVRAATAGPSTTCPTSSRSIACWPKPRGLRWTVSDRYARTR